MLKNTPVSTLQGISDTKLRVGIHFSLPIYNVERSILNQSCLSFFLFLKAGNERQENLAIF